MANLNRVLLIGNCTRDIELRYTSSGTEIAEFSIAVNRNWTDQNGNKQQEVTFVDITLFGRLAEIAQQYLCKGAPVFIEGRLQLDTWEQNGQKRSRLRVIGENLQLLAKREGAEAAPRAATPAPARPAFTPERPAPVVKTPRIEPDLDVGPF